MTNNDNQITSTHILIVLLLLALFFVTTQSYQLSLLLNDRSTLRQGMAAQNEQFDQAQRLQKQLSGLVNGTLQLAERGNKNVVPVITRLRELNVIPAAQPGNNSAAAFPAPVPAARETPERGPIKP
jgi:hypothetical protein